MVSYKWLTDILAETEKSVATDKNAKRGIEIRSGDVSKAAKRVPRACDDKR